MRQNHQVGKVNQNLSSEGEEEELAKMRTTSDTQNLAAQDGCSPVTPLSSFLSDVESSTRITAPNVSEQPSAPPVTYYA